MKKKPLKKSAGKKTPKKPAPRSRKKQPVKKTRLPGKIILSSVLAALVLLSSLFILHSSFIKSVIPKDREYAVTRGASVSSVARDLELGLLYRFFVEVFGGMVQAGTYDLPANASVFRIARMTAKGEIASTVVTIPEGWTVKQVINRLNENQFLSGEIKNPYKDGDLFPDTYTFAKGTMRRAALDLMAKKMTNVRFELTDGAFSPPAPLKTWEEVVILASIVQKETPVALEMPTVASVYLNRLNGKMRLQADPTVVYAITNGLGDMEGRPLLSKHLWIQSPYNTYRNRGLPPAPIANPGKRAINAVLRPAKTDFYYFVADGFGGHNFSITLDEHNRHRSLWLEIKKSRN
ncbi:MAG: endolytic transglycosylase MltG [Rickettsiales bacterium]|jgi:UPF0755 protein|nr:endolytic transglycosylase MltG [Rickettsiales bacterium]